MCENFTQAQHLYKTACVVIVAHKRPESDTWVKVQVFEKKWSFFTYNTEEFVCSVSREDGTESWLHYSKAIVE